MANIKNIGPTERGGVDLSINERRANERADRDRQVRVRNERALVNRVQSKDRDVRSRRLEGDRQNERRLNDDQRVRERRNEDDQRVRNRRLDNTDQTRRPSLNASA
ncbi:MAG: hypothetical protein HY606_00245 [Planctomycetes bacterium]|nr:hypothetical protein [Planctomycetota bacterium]